MVQMSPRQLNPFQSILAIFLCGITAAIAWVPGVIPPAPLRMASSGFRVNSQDRGDVVAFWQAVYLASEGYETRVNWTGNFTGNNGTVSGSFVDDVERRVNYFRAMAGLSANVQVNSGSRVSVFNGDPFIPAPQTLKAAAAQDAALMLIRNYNPLTGANPAATHNPASSLVGWSATAWNAASKGNLSFGLYGPGAITEYLVERFENNTASSSWNLFVGHRRWILYSGATDFATGDQPGLPGVTTPPTNVLYVVQNQAELDFTGNSQFVSYPTAGFMPAQLNTPFWSLSRMGADFSNASVQMTDANGVPVPITGLRISSEFGDPAIMWTVPASASLRAVSADTSFHVTVSGISGNGIPTSHSYTVTLINPKQLVQAASESVTPGASHLLDGPASVAPGGSARFSFTPLAAADALQVGTFLQSNLPWKETAEVATAAKVIRSAGTAVSYPLMVNPASFLGFGALTGSSAFRLTIPVQVDPLNRSTPEQSFEVDRDILPEAPQAARVAVYYRRNPLAMSGRELLGPTLPSTSATLSFQYRRGYMTPTTFLVAEASTDGGASWAVLGDPISGFSTTQMDKQATTTTRALPVTGNSVRVRFRLFWKGTQSDSYFIHQGSERFPTGIFIDEITTTNCSELVAKSVTTLAPTATQFTFDSVSAGTPLLYGSTWQIRLRTKLSGNWFHYGPSKVITIGTP